MEFGFTESILAENEVLKKRLEHIKDQIEEYFEEPEKDTIGFLLRLKDICSGKCCNTCKYWAIEEQVCVNADSEHCADFTLPNHSCPNWKTLKEVR
jgi:hypothetical protein